MPTMRVAVTIQTHPSRADLATALQGRLSGSTLTVDPDPAGRPSPWRTYREALLAAPADASHLLVIQDDARPCGHLVEVLPQIAAARPDDLVVLYVGGLPHDHVRQMSFAASKGDPFAVLYPGYYVPAVAVLWPAAAICPLVCWVEEQDYPPEFTADDEIIGRAADAVGVRVVATVPSLVQHPDMVDSLVRHRVHRAGADPARVASRFIGDGDPREIDWR